ncbi:hypothetical protein Poly51_00100 [Rubripirellula tenax]|uniref:Ribonuclease HIII n=1 Tax=Rubripirellula tenax TaxID=2528015 RepID=A0A5C6FE19_9BACT|nr:hypothetical protein [Rubripirellula tenax]TWU59738.1 hypothetical protein Poly51_00100 [Rubripirellula tenax]
MLLIATDEAGYGPKLGPLVIAATAWKIPGEGLNHDAIDAAFAILREPAWLGSLKIKVDDSKSVYKPGAGLAVLHAVVSASHHWCGQATMGLREMLMTIAADDFASIEGTPWLRDLSDEAYLSPTETKPLLATWKSNANRLVDVRCRVITASRFNAACVDGMNKADLLSESTIGLAKSMIDSHAADEREVVVYCDRHGGRRYYSGVLGHVFPDATIAVIAESKQRSAYRLTEHGKTIDIAFTVKGDSFTPVALSSMHAKYLRERLMQSLNRYFADRDKSKTLTPTAGYPVDADRFLAAIEPTIRREKINRDNLIRCR